MDRARAARPWLGERSRRDPWRSDEPLQPARDDADVDHEGDEDEATRARREKIERLAADVDLHLRLALIGFTGPEYHEFQTELTRYGLDVMTGWLRSGKIFAKMHDARLGIAHPREGALDHDAQDELAGETVAIALHRFHHDVLLRGKWDPRKGASLTTYFIGQCKIRFANIYRSWLEKETGGARLIDPTAADPRMNTPTATIDSPEWKAVARGYIRRGTRAVRDPRVHRVLELIATDHTQAEIAVDLGVSEKAIERMLANNRDRIRKLGIA
ncbi:hypothetical protein [Pseudonocardia broussonetiae]|uniref:Uncharacterized protein n=1 Tax=Pseudonocardia broussonetiae TaxID=2736640 RepID=A0A6M6JX99_9PSEU|nr:hypothetical protein [Pseudonocardia broussonetiae]QJY51152.1 hypothetical protein HOP40_34795 [Pseudonocardia broussonetiae]